MLFEEAVLRPRCGIDDGPSAHIPLLVCFSFYFSVHQQHDFDSELRRRYPHATGLLMSMEGAETVLLMLVHNHFCEL